MTNMIYEKGMQNICIIFYNHEVNSFQKLFMRSELYYFTDKINIIKKIIY